MWWTHCFLKSSASLKKVWNAYMLLILRPADLLQNHWAIHDIGAAALKPFHHPRALHQTSPARSSPRPVLPPRIRIAAQIVSFRKYPQSRGQIFQSSGEISLLTFYCSTNPCSPSPFLVAQIPVAKVVATNPGLSRDRIARAPLTIFSERDMLDAPWWKSLRDQPPWNFFYPINPLFIILTKCSCRGLKTFCTQSPPSSLSKPNVPVGVILKWKFGYLDQTMCIVTITIWTTDYALNWTVTIWFSITECAAYGRCWARSPVTHCCAQIR